MKKFHKNSTITILAVLFVVGLIPPVTAHAATSPSLGATSTYGVVSSTYTNSLNAGLETRIVGDVCYTTPPDTAPISISGATVTPCADARGTDQSSALADLNGQACTDLGAGPITLNSVVVGGNPAGTFPPGCYSTAGAMNITASTTVTLSGIGTYILRSGGALTTGANSIVLLAGGANASDVFWAPVGATTLGANSATSATPTFVGNIFRGTAAGLSITLGHFANLLGRTLAFGSTVTTDSNTITVPATDTTAPTVVVTMDDAALNIGDTSLVTFTFSETPVGFTTADVTVANGAIGAIDASNPLVQTATYTPTNGITDATNIITVGTGWTDAALNTGVGDDSPNYTIDTVAPSVTVTMSDATLTFGETSLVTFTFTEAPTGFTTADVTVANGSIGAINASNPLIQTATYTPTNGIIDATNVITVGTAWTDAALNTGVGDDSPNYTIDTTVVSPTAIVTMDDDALNIGDTSLVTFTFSETPVGFTTADVTVANGAIGAIDASNPLIQTATYTPTNGITDATNVITVGTAWTDVDLNIGVGDDSPNYTIDTVAPFVTVTMADAILTTGETSLVTFTFSEAPAGFTVADVTSFPNGTLSGFTVTGNPLIYTATFTPDVSIIDAINVITVGTAWTDAALNVGVGDDSPNYTIDTTAPATTETITVIKLVVGGTKVVSDFPLFINGSPVTSGATNSFNAPATYTVTETSNTNYTASFSGFCPSGIITLALGTPKVCTITNTYIAPASPSGSSGVSITPLIPPLIDVVKVPSPLALPAGSGPVTYTYTLRNTGTVPVTNLTMVGDTCSPIVLFSGDTNSDTKLDINETWVYRCSTTLLKTHTNTVVATGWANGISAVDIANATVVVGIPIVPPLIHVTKIPNPLILPALGGAVTYAYTVTNPGTAPLSNVSIVDDKCTGLPGRVLGHPGDLNKNNLLESNEAWSFTCKTNLTKTTTNTGTALGSANGLTATDFAIATVVVASPRFPNTGFPPKEKITPWNYVVDLWNNLFNKKLKF